MKETLFFPAEWHPQSGVQVTWPHRDTDWKENLEEVTGCYVAFSREILEREKLLVVCRGAGEVAVHFTAGERANLLLHEIPNNDTWTRDHGGVGLFYGSHPLDGKLPFDEGQPFSGGVPFNGWRPLLVDFGFNGWGLKFAANHDNQITRRLYDRSAFRPEVAYQNRLDFILEGGSIETDGAGTLLTTSRCLLSPNRNGAFNQARVEEQLKLTLGVERVLWLDHGFLEGDDTDSHIDTLARFCDEATIAYVACDDDEDVHYGELKEMERELKALVTSSGEPYRLLPLPMADALYHEGRRLPATYANFLIINGAVLMPFYGSPKDGIARGQLQVAFPDREVIGIDCQPLIKQSGSLHCVTMQLPAGFL